MQPTGLSLIFIKKGALVPETFSPVIEEARQSIAGLSDEHGKPYSPADAGIDGSCDLAFLLCDGKPAGVMSCEVREDDVQLTFCHVSADGKAYEGQFFTLVVGYFLGEGIAVVRSNFLWPSPERCIEAAMAMGFRLIERIEMARESDGGYPVKPLPDGIGIGGWPDGCLDAAARLLSENGNEIDRQIYPQEQTFAGARAQLEKIAGGTYGAFLAGQSLIVRAGGELIGMILATEEADGTVLVAQVVLDRRYRGRGIASAMMGRLIRNVAERGRRRIRLMVNAQNADAIRLYERKGFRPLFVYRQYILNGGK